MNHPQFFILLVILAMLTACQPTEKAAPKRPDYTLVIHGGAGAIRQSDMTPTLDSAYRATLHDALDAGEAVLSAGGPALEAVSAAIRVMEDSPLFNAGKGAVFTHEGTNELDASIMDGRDLRAGAVGGITLARHPIDAARSVMEKSDHVFLTGRGADQFILEIGLDTVSPDYFFTQRRWDSLQKARQQEERPSGETPSHDRKFGTVGAVALDQQGHLAAGTSTGGMTNKRWSRIGDSPVIGAGTWADDRSCAVSCTGHGEYFIRYAVAHELAARVRYTSVPLDESATSILEDELRPVGGLGGLIALDTTGQISMPFTTDGMYRGFTRPGKRLVAIYRDE